MFKFYQAKIFPFLMNKNIGRPEIIEYRRHVLQNAKGNILEIGIGTGLNLNLYPKDVTEISAADPYARELPHSRIKIKIYPDVAEKMSFEDNTFDTVVSTFTLCSVENLDSVMGEIARVLKPNGQFIFLEHGEADSRFFRSIQVLANPFFNLLACGCNVTRDYKKALLKAGFSLKQFEVHHTSIFPRGIANYLYEGVAVYENDKINL